MTKKKKVERENITMSLDIMRPIEQFREIVYSPEVMNHPVIHLALSQVFERLNNGIENHRKELQKINDRFESAQSRQNLEVK